jgi:hypothetical protein
MLRWQFVDVHWYCALIAGRFIAILEYFGIFHLYSMMAIPIDYRYDDEKKNC